MARNHFIELDAQLCEYIVSQFRRHLTFGSARPVVNDPSLSKPQKSTCERKPVDDINGSRASISEGKQQDPAAKLDTPKPRTKPKLYWTLQLDFPGWMSWILGKDELYLSERLWRDRATYKPEVLTTNQICEFKKIARFAPYQFEDLLVWRSDAQILQHSLYITSILRKRLTESVANRWTKSSEKYCRRLHKRNLSVCDGIAIVEKWLHSLRHYRNVIEEDNSPVSSDESESMQQANMLQATLIGSEKLSSSITDTLMESDGVKFSNAEEVALRQYRQATLAMKSEGKENPTMKELWEWCRDEEMPIQAKDASWQRTVRRALKRVQAAKPSNQTARQSTRSAVHRSHYE